MRLLNGMAWLLLLVSTAWVLTDPSFESGVAVIAAFSGLAATFFKKRNTDDDARGQHQKVSGRSSGIQAGRDVKIRAEREGDD